MPASFLLLHGELTPDERARVEARGAQLVPFAPTHTTSWSRPELNLHVWVWSCFPASARGAWSHAQDEPATFSCLDGWIVEDADLSQSVAEAFYARVRRHFEDAIADLDGCWVGLHVDAAGVARAAADGAGAQHCYFGERGDVVAISNRSMLAAMGLGRGEWPTLRPDFFAWWLSFSMAPLLPDESPWRGVQALYPSQWLELEGGRLRVLERPAARPYSSWDEARAAHLERATAWRRLPGVSTRLTLTGGKDSRAILAAILATGAHEELDHAYIRAPEEHPDVIVARQLCERCGIELQVASLDTLFEDTLLEQMRVHIFRSEGWLHTWDVKAPRRTLENAWLGGHFGELYRSHFQAFLALGWPVVRRVLTRPGAIDKHDVLSAPAEALLRRRVNAWLDRQQDRGVPSHRALDMWHREARMWQWASDALRTDGVGNMAMTPLASARLTATYDRQALLARRAERIHFELMQVGPGWLWRHPFANATWHRELLPWLRERPTPALKRSTWRQASRHYLLWQRFGAEARAYLLEPGDDAFYEVFDRAGVEDLLARYDATEDGLLLKGIFGLVGARVATREPLTMSQVLPMGG